MTLLSYFLEAPLKPQASHPTVYPRERRKAERFDVSLPVSIQARGVPPVDGTVINLSVGGAAIRIDRWDDRGPEAWLARLDQDTELLLMGLLDEPMSCWVIVYDKCVLRVCFEQEKAAELSKAIHALA